MKCKRKRSKNNANHNKIRSSRNYRSNNSSSNCNCSINNTKSRNSSSKFFINIVLSNLDYGLALVPRTWKTKTPEKSTLLQTLSSTRSTKILSTTTMSRSPSWMLQ